MKTMVTVVFEVRDRLELLAELYIEDRLDHMDDWADIIDNYTVVQSEQIDEPNDPRNHD